MQADAVTRALLIVISLCLLVLIAQGVTGDSSEGTEGSAAGGSPAAQRYDVRSVALMRGAPLLVRSDTATGQTWKMGIADAAEWKPMREGPDGVPSPDGQQNGRYVISAVSLWRSPPTLVRVDRVSGRLWRKGSTSDGPWVLVPNPPEEGTPGEATSAESSP